MTDDKDMISSRIPWIKVTSRAYMGFLASHQKLSFWRAGGEAPVSISPEGIITVQGLKHTVAQVRMRAHNLKDGGKWYYLNGDFDADWRMSKNTQSLAVFSNHNLKFSAEVSAGFKSGYKRDSTGKWVSTPEITASGKITIKEGGSKFRAISELERRQVFLTNIGGQSTEEILVKDGIQYNVKQIGIIKYIFNHWHTSLVE